MRLGEGEGGGVVGVEKNTRLKRVFRTWGGILGEGRNTGRGRAW
jgi:hypothetical protein